MIDCTISFCYYLSGSGNIASLAVATIMEENEGTG